MLQQLNAQRESDAQMLITRVSSSRQFLDTRIVDIKQMKESMFKSPITYYTIKSTSSLLSLYEKDKEYTVQRRFNDFKRLYSALK